MKNDLEKLDLEYIADYYPYGKVLREFVNGEVERFLSTEHERDKETGFDYRGARFYDSDVGRFLSLDPLADVYLSWSPYNYALCNPISLVDEDGRSPGKPRSLKKRVIRSGYWTNGGFFRQPTPWAYAYNQETMDINHKEGDIKRAIRKTNRRDKLNIFFGKATPQNDEEGNEIENPFDKRSADTKIEYQEVHEIKSVGIKKGDKVLITVYGEEESQVIEVVFDGSTKNFKYVLSTGDTKSEEITIEGDITAIAVKVVSGSNSKDFGGSQPFTKIKTKQEVTIYGKFL